MAKTITSPSVHRFDDTGDAYDSTQCDDSIKDGDVIVVESEGVVGVLIQAWPVAVTEKHGDLHTPVEGFDWESVENLIGFTNGYAADSEPIYEHVDYSAAYALAQSEAAKLAE